MFTGIVEGTGKVLKISPGRLVVGAPFALTHEEVGASVAVNGCCLTIVRKQKKQFEADLSRETLRVTNLGKLRLGGVVNLERPLCLGDRLGGHLVMGHVDAVGKVLETGKIQGGMKIKITYPARLRPYIIPKGSIAVDGISMTVNDLTAQYFSLVVVPHTLRKTNLLGRKKGDLVNLEVDMLGKYVIGFKSKEVPI